MATNDDTTATGKIGPTVTDRPKKRNLIFRLNDIPPTYLCVLLGLQHYMTMFGGTISYPYLLAPKMCIRDADPAKGYLIATTLFVSGLATVLQTTFGVRLPIIQGSSFTFLLPTLTILSLPKFECPTDAQIIAGRPNGTNYLPDKVDDLEYEEIWQVRMREIQGAIIVGSLFEVFIGVTGLVGIILKVCTPLAIVPTISLIGLSLFENASRNAGQNWTFAIITIVMMIVLSQYMVNVKIYLPAYNRSRGWHWKSINFLKMFPVLLTIVFVWSLCAILTVTNVLPSGHAARTDNADIDILYKSPWFRFPYPFQWGWPTISVSAVLGIMMGIIASVVESIGDYYGCARLAEVERPPTHAINRGIWIEGLSCVLSGMWGSGGGLTSYSENIGAIGVTRIASRRVVQVAGIIIMIVSLFVKFSALFAAIPPPIIGGLFCVMFSIVVGVGLSPLQFVDLNSTRNVFIIGFSIFMGIAVPKWLEVNAGAINTGSEFADQLLTVMLRTGTFIGMLLGMFLDNTIPGTNEERGLTMWLNHSANGTGTNGDDTNNANDYDLPWGITRSLQKSKIASFVPISPTFDEELVVRKIRSMVVKKVRSGSNSNVQPQQVYRISENV